MHDSMRFERRPDEGIETDERREATEADVDAMTKRLIKQTKGGRMRASRPTDADSEARRLVHDYADLIRRSSSGRCSSA